MVKDNIIAAISTLIQEDKLGRDGKPKLADIKALCGFTVTKTQRDELLEEAQTLVRIMAESKEEDVVEAEGKEVPVEESPQQNIMQKWFGNRFISGGRTKPAFEAFSRNLKAFWNQESRLNRYFHHPSMHLDEKQCDKCSSYCPDAAEEYERI